MARTHKRRHTRKHKQRGGDGVGYTGVAFNVNGAPAENRISYSHCGPEMRMAPDVGTRTLWGGRRRRTQRGGGCCGVVYPSAMTGGGAGTGGYSMVFDNSLDKTYSAIDKAVCPPPAQAGGASIYEQVAFPASYGYDTGSAYLSDSAHFLIPKGDVSRCASGGRRRRSRKHRRHGRK